MKVILRAIALSVLAACAEREAPAPAPEEGPQKMVSDAADRANLLNIGYGAGVISRTGELSLDHSAIRAIDGDPISIWTSPPGTHSQTLTFVLPHPARLEGLGARVGISAQVATSEVTFETSVDGTKFVPAGTHRFERKPEDQLFNIPPVAAQYVRVTTKPETAPFNALASVHARGTFTGTSKLQPVAGCWLLNGTAAGFVERGGRIAGAVGTSEPIHLEGWQEEMTYRFAWSRGQGWGYALISISPDGQRLTGIRWFEIPISFNFGDGWFGERQQCTPVVAAGTKIFRPWLRQAGRYPLFTLSENGEGGGLDTIVEVLRLLGNQRMTLRSREMREATPELNLQRSQKRLDAVRAALARRGIDAGRIDFVAVGSGDPDPNVTQPLRLLYSTVSIEIPQSARSAF